MEPADPGETTAGAGRPPSSAPPIWLRLLATWVGAALLVGVLVVVGGAVLPGWWADLVGGWVQGVSSRGIVLGLVVGAVFVLLPMGAAALALRRGLSTGRRVLLILLSVLLALPNLLTLVIVLSGGDPRAVLATEAPGFRGASLVGAVLALVALAVVVVARTSARRTQRKVSAAQERAAQVVRDRAAQQEPPDSSPPPPNEA